MKIGLREAAAQAGVSEEHLRKAILDGRLIAEPVADERDYLIMPEALGSLAKNAPRSRGRRCKSVILVSTAIVLLIPSSLALFFPRACPHFMRPLVYLMHARRGPPPPACSRCGGAILEIGYGLRMQREGEEFLGGVVLRDGTRVGHTRVKGKEFFEGG